MSILDLDDVWNNMQMALKPIELHWKVWND